MATESWMPMKIGKSWYNGYNHGMNMLMERYADVILRQALRLKDGDVLSINTEEENSDFAHLIARKARAITGNGSYIQNIENGKVTGTVEAASDYPIEKKPTALLYLPVYRGYEEAETGKLYTAPELQRFRHLSDPLETGKPMLPFVSAPVPSEAWGRVLDEEGSLSLPFSLLSDLLSLGEDEYLQPLDEIDLLLYERDRLNGLGAVSARIRDEEGTDLSFRFLPGSRFASGIEETADGRRFIPSVYASDIFRAIDPSSAQGYFTATRPFLLFGHIVHSFSARVESGRITEWTTDDESARLFRIYLEQDNAAGNVSELSMAEESSKAAFIEYFALPEWDRMRGAAITLGGPRPESLVDDQSRSMANDSLLTLTIPIGSDTTVITAAMEDGSETVLMEDGYIREE